jgi:hypothetical protein
VKTNKLKLGTVAIAAVLMSVVMTSSVPDCPPYSPYLVPNPEDCGSYYQCSNGVPILFNCPPGLHFNASLEVCDWPNSANCIDSWDNYIPKGRSVEGWAIDRQCCKRLGILSSCESHCYVPLAGMRNCTADDKLRCPCLDGYQ